MRSMGFAVPSAVFLTAALLFTAPSKAQSSDDEKGGPRVACPDPPRTATILMPS